MRASLAVHLLIAVLAWLTPSPADARQVALVIGNARYTSLDPLKNPKRDAAAIADRLRDLDFEVQEVFDGDVFAMQRAAERFLASARGADLALFYFAGHGIQLFDRNVLLAGDADPQTANQIEALGLDLTQFLARLRAAGPVRSAILIDACRDNPMTFDETVALLGRVAPAASSSAIQAARSSKPRGLAMASLPASTAGSGQTLMFFAAQPGEVSFDGDGQNSFFVEGIKEALAHTNRPISQALQQASAYVRTVTNGRQVPQIVSDWTSDVVLGRTETPKVRYLNTSGAGGRTLSEDQIRQIGVSRRAIPALSGTFVVRESQSFIDAWLADEQLAKRARSIGTVNGFAFDYDLDRDGRPETLAVYFRQVTMALALVKESVTTLATPCHDNDEVETAELALRDINGDRRPEIFLHLKTKDQAWGTFCILEYTGTPDVAASRRGPGGERFDDGRMLRVLLRQTTSSVRIGEDNTIETCDGSNCHTRSVIRFDGNRFRMTLDESDPPSADRARPFRDEAERRGPASTASAAVADPRPTAAAPPAPRSGPPAAIEQRIADFVTNVYLHDGNTGATTTRFADVVQYYGKPRRREEVLAEKRAYYARWTSRRYGVVPGSITVAGAVQRNVHEVAFEYDFALVRGGPQSTTSRGRGRTRLTVRADAQGFVVTREEGEVLSRQ